MICLTACSLALVLTVYAKIRGYCDFNYYPGLGRLVDNPMVVVWLGLILLCLALPAAISWGWGRSPYLRSRI